MRREKKNIFFLLTTLIGSSRRLFIPITIGIFLFFVFILPVQAIIIAPTATVGGTVRDANTNQTIPGARLMVVETFTDPNCVAEFGENKCFDNHYIFNETTTNSSGSYNFIVDACGMSSLLVIVKEGYQNFSQPNSFACWSSQVKNILLTPDNPVLPEPVIIIPGIMASWNRYLLDKNLEYADEWVLDPHFHTYDQLISDLQTYGGYVLGQTLFTFPYDWRKNNEFTAQLLRSRIQDIKAQTGASKVDIVAHSMGGLIVRYYIESELYQDDIDQLIFIATPQRGAPKAYLAWEGGFLGTSIVSDFLLEVLIAKIAKTDGFCDSVITRNTCVYNYIRNYPVATVKQLLPDNAYLESALTSELLLYPDNHPNNDFLEFLNNQESLAKLYDSGIEISTIYNSTPNSTVAGIKVIDREAGQVPFWEYGYPHGFTSLLRNNGIIKGNGDGTVTIDSSIYLDSTRNISKLSTNHSKIVSLSAKNVIEILKGEFIDIQVIDQPDEYVIIQVHSPINAQIATPQGKIVGQDFASGVDVNEVEGAYYSGSGATNEYIVLPLVETGEYEVSLQGTGSGEYKVEIILADEQGISSKAFSGQIAPEVVIDLKFQINEQEIGEILPVDKTDPVITITSPEVKEYEHHLLVPIQYLATDDSGQITTSTIWFDSEEYGGENIDLFVWELGEHKLVVKSSDWSGNSAEQEVVFTVIATITSLRSDINRLYDEGEIKNQKTKQQLLTDTEVLQKLLQFYKPYLASKHPFFGMVIDKIIGEVISKRLSKYLRQGYISVKTHQILKTQMIYIIKHY